MTALTSAFALASHESILTWLGAPSSFKEVADGLAVYSSLRGPERAGKMRDAIDSGGAGSTLTTLSMEFVFGKIWSREGLDRQRRSLVTIGILIALRQTDELKNHIRIGHDKRSKRERRSKKQFYRLPFTLAFRLLARPAMPSWTFYRKEPLRKDSIARANEHDRRNDRHCVWTQQRWLAPGSEIRPFEDILIRILKT